MPRSKKSSGVYRPNSKIKRTPRLSRSASIRVHVEVWNRYVRARDVRGVVLLIIRVNRVMIVSQCAETIKKNVFEGDNIYTRSEYHTQLAKMSFDEIFDLTAGVYFNFYNILSPLQTRSLLTKTRPPRPSKLRPPLTGYSTYKIQLIKGYISLHSCHILSPPETDIIVSAHRLTKITLLTLIATL